MKKIKKTAEPLWCHDKLGHARVVSLIRTSPACRDKVDAIRKKFNIPKGGFVFYADILEFRKIFSDEKRDMLNDPEFIKIEALGDVHGTDSVPDRFNTYIKRQPSSIWTQMLSDLTSMVGADGYLGSHIEEYILYEGSTMVPSDLFNFNSAAGNPYSKPYSIDVVKEDGCKRFVIHIFGELSKKHWALIQQDVNKSWKYISKKRLPRLVRNRNIYERILLGIETREKNPKKKETNKEFYKRIFPNKPWPGDDNFKKQIIAANKFRAKEKGEI